MFSQNIYDQLVRENFNLSDRYTRKYIIALEDAGQEQLIAALSNALYDKIVSKIVDIDFGTIPMSRGDITKVEGYDNTVECLNIMRRLVLEYRQNPAVVDVVLTAIANVKERKGKFIKAYSLNIELPMVIYNTIVLSIERSVSLLISTCMQFIKDPGTTTPKAALDKVAYNNTMDDVLFKQLINFNNMCNNKSLDKVIDELLKNPPKAGAIRGRDKRFLKRLGVKEEVETMYGTVSPIDEDDPLNTENEPSQEDPAVYNGSDYAPEDQDDQESPFEPDSDEEPFNDTDHAPESNDVEPSYSDPDENTGDEEADDLLDRLGGTTDDTVEPENIPSVVPGDCVSSDDQAISEDPATNDSDETQEGPQESPEQNPDAQIPAADNQEVGVDEFTVGTALTAAGALAATHPITLGVPMAIGGAVILFKGSAFIIKSLIELIRLGIYLFYHTKLKFQDYLEVQADLIEANANDLQYSTTTTLTDNDREKVIKKQLKTAKKLRDWANKFSIDNKQATNAANREIMNDAKDKYTIGPNDDGYDSLF